jgi:hypothetical protein
MEYSIYLMLRVGRVMWVSDSEFIEHCIYLILRVGRVMWAVFSSGLLRASQVWYRE